MTTASKLELEYIDGYHWLLTAEFRAFSTVLGRALSVPAWFVTDFNSIPRPLWALLSPAAYGEAAVAHDYLYRYNTVTRLQADQVHRELMIWKGAPAWKVFLYYRGLRLGGWRSWRRYRKAEREGAGGGTV